MLNRWGDTMRYLLVMTHIAMENIHRIVNLPIKHGDFPQLCHFSLHEGTCNAELWAYSRRTNKNG